MKEIIYHGSDHIIEYPEYGKGSVHNDYGRGFYCTRSRELAMEWACGDGHNGFANKYEIDLTSLSCIDLNSSTYNILNWLAVLARHRTYWQQSGISAEAKEYLQEHFYVDTSGYDVVIGYRADDSYFSFAQDFVAGAISLQKLKRAMYLGDLGQQIVLISEKAFSAISFTEALEADAEIYYSKRTERDLAARRAYRQERSKGSAIDDLYMLDIMREGITNGDPRLQ